MRSMCVIEQIRESQRWRVTVNASGAEGKVGRVVVNLAISIVSERERERLSL